MRSVRFLFAFVVIALLMSASLAAQAQVTTPADMPAYAVRGPFSVGRTWFILSKGTDNPLLLVAWYPALKRDGNQPIVVLTVPDDYKLADSALISMDSVANWGSGTLNAAPDTSKAPYPLVIFSPGYTLGPLNYVSLEEHLASYGFIVLSALIKDGDVWTHYFARPVLAPHEIDAAEKLTGLDGSFKGLIDTKHIGVAGHSAGGYTALAAAGAQFNLTWFESWCVDHHTLNGLISQVCSELSAHTQDMLALAKLDSMPKALWPSWGDPRVTAIVSQAGEAFPFGPAGLSPVTIPIMVQTGTQDTIVPSESGASLTYDNVSSTQKVQVAFDGGDHGVFVDGNPGPSDLIHHFTTAFLLDVLKGDKDAHKALLPDAVKFAGVQYKTTLK